MLEVKAADAPPLISMGLPARVAHPSVIGKMQLPASDRVAPGRYRPRAPTDPSLKEFCVSRPAWQVFRYTLRASRQTGFCSAFLVLV